MYRMQKHTKEEQVLINPYWRQIHLYPYDRCLLRRVNLLASDTGCYWFCVVRHGKAERLDRTDRGRVRNSGIN